MALVLSGPERIDLALFGVGSPDLLNSTPDHETHLAARRVQCPAVVLARRTMDGDDLRTDQGPAPMRPTSLAIRSWATSCPNPRPADMTTSSPSRRWRH